MPSIEPDQSRHEDFRAAKIAIFKETYYTS